MIEDVLTKKQKGLKMNKRTILLLLIVAQVALAGCETTKGVGKDMQKAGQSIQKTAEHND